MGGEATLGLWPAADTPGFDRVPPSEEVTRRRVDTLALLRQRSPALVVASPAGLLRPTLPPDAIAAALELSRGLRLSRESVLRTLVALGYRRVDAVTSPGEMAVRGGIVDVFGLDRSRPWRAEWFGDEVDDIRPFEVSTQTSVGRLESVSILPARELDLRPDTVERALAAIAKLDISACRPEVREQWETDRAQLQSSVYDDGVDLFAPYLNGSASLWDHLGSDVLVLVAGGVDRARRAALRHAEEMEGLRAQEEARGELPAGAWSGLLEPAGLEAQLDRAVELLAELPADGAGIDLGWRGAEPYAGRWPAFPAQLGPELGGGGCVLVVSRQERRVEELTAEAGLEPLMLEDTAAEALPAAPGALLVAAGEVSAGFRAPELELAVFTDHELFGTVKRRGSPLARGARRVESTSARGARRAASGRAAAQAFVLQFEPGELVVHRDHGVGRFVEMRRVAVDGTEGDGAAAGLTVEREYMVLEYADCDRLLVPVEHLDRVDRYIGGSDAHPALSRLGTGEWERAKRRVRERTEAVARDLLGLYSRREAAQGHAFAPDSRLAARAGSLVPLRGDAATRCWSSTRSSATWRRHGRWTAWSAATLASARPSSPCGRRSRPWTRAGRWPCWCPPPSSASSTFSPSRSGWPLPGHGAPALPDSLSEEEQRAALLDLPRRDRRHRHRHPPPAPERCRVQEPRAGGPGRGAALRRAPEGALQAAAGRSRRALALRDPDPAHPAHGAGGDPRPLGHPDPARGAAADQDLCHRQ